MDERLRPSTLGEILDRTAHLYRRNFWLFVGTALLPLMFIFALTVPLVAIFAAAGIAGNFNPSDSIPIVLAMVLGGLAAMVIYLGINVFVYAGITNVTVSLLRGEKPTFRSTLLSVKPRFWTYLGYMLLQGVFIGVLPAAGACVFIFPLAYLISRPGADLGSQIGLGFLIGLIALTALGVIIWLALSYSMGMAVCVAEGKSAWESLVRSWRLSSGTRGRIFVTYLLVIALSIAISMALSIPVLIITFLAPRPAIGTAGLSAPLVIYQIVKTIVDFASQMLLTPVSFIAFTLFYFDQRIRKEGYDIEWMMQQAGLTERSAAPAPAINSASFPPVTPPDTLREP